MTRRLRRLCLVAAATLVGTVAVMFGPAPGAGAHTFLVRTVPAQGERLDQPTGEVSLEFSEAFDVQGVSLVLTVEGRRETLLAESAQGGRVLRADVASDREGVYVVTWEVVAEDGHQSAGELAFAVGAHAGEVPGAQTGSSSPDLLRIAMGWVFFVGLALAVGSLAADWAGASSFRLGLYRSTVLAALGAALVVWVDAVIGDESNRQRVPLAVAAVALAIALPLARIAWRWHLPTALALGGAALAWSARGHDAVGNGVAGFVLDGVHLVAGAAWVGALLLLVVDLRRDGGEAGKLTIARRYARLAAILVGVLALAGAGSAFLLLDRWSDLWGTGYGQALLVKTALFLAALTVAAIARRALRAEQPGRLRQVTPVEATLLVAVLAVTAILTNIAPPAADAPAAGASLLGPPPMPGPVVRDAGLAGNLTVSVTASADQLRVEVFVPGGQPAAGADMDVEGELPDGRGITLVPRPCGPGCVTQRMALPPGRTRLDVTASTDDWPEGTYQAELDTPPVDADPALLPGLVARIQALPAVGFVETTTSGPGSVVTPQAFRLSGAELVGLEPWAGGTDDIQALKGENGFRLYIPGERIWITVWLDEQGRLARERIVTMSHEIVHDDFVYPRT